MLPSSRDATFKRVFLVVDTATVSRYTITLTVWFAREFNASVVIAHVAEQPAGGHRTLGLLGAGQNEFKDERMAELRRVKSQIAGAVNDVKTIYKEETKPSVELLRLANQRRADLVIAEVKNETAYAAESLFSKSHCPVLLVGLRSEAGQSGRCGVKRVVFATGSSRLSIETVAYAFSLVKAFRARLFVVGWPPPSGELEPSFWERASSTVSGVEWDLWEPRSGQSRVNFLMDTLECINLVRSNLLVVNGALALEWFRAKTPELHRLLEEAPCPVMILPAQK